MPSDKNPTRLINVNRANSYLAQRADDTASELAHGEGKQRDTRVKEGVHVMIIHGLSLRTPKQGTVGEKDAEDTNDISENGEGCLKVAAADAAGCRARCRTNRCIHHAGTTELMRDFRPNSIAFNQYLRCATTISPTSSW